MAEAIDTAFVVVKPDTRGFGAETRRQVATQLRSTPIPGPVIQQPRQKQRDLLPSAGIRGPAIRGLLSIGTQLTAVTGGIVATTLAIRAAFNEVAEGQAVAAQTQSILKGTGNVASVSAEGIARYSGELSKLSGIDDEVVQTGANIILTFKNVRNVAGEGNAIFDQTLATAVDLSRVAGGAFGDLNSTSKQLGKALNDPVKGMTALSRSGVTFTQGQKDTIKQLVETGRTLDAQKFILAEVRSQIGPAAEAYGKTLPGAIDRTKNAVSNLLGQGLERVAPGLASGTEAVAEFFENLEDGGKGAGAIKGAFEVIRSALAPLFKAIRSEGPRIKTIFQTIGDTLRKDAPVFKLIATIVGGILVVAFKLAVRQIELMVRVVAKIHDVIREAVRVILVVLEKLIDGAGKVASGLNTILPGNPFQGAEDGANAAKAAIQGVIDEIDRADGKQATVTVTVRRREEGDLTGASGPGGGNAAAPDATGGSRTGIQNIPGPREAREQQLIAKLAVESAKDNVAGQRALLVQLAAFYAESLRLARQRGVTRRDYEAKYQQALTDIRNIDQAAADDAKQAADDAKQAHAEMLAATDQERRDLLEFRIQLAAGTKRILRDDRAAWDAYIRYLRERVRLAKAAGVGIAAARAELLQARRDATQAIKDAVQARFDEQEAFLTGQVELFDITGNERRQAAAYRKLIAFYKRMVKREGLTRIERQKYRIALAQTRKDLADLKNETGDTGKEGATFGQLAVDFLKNLHGFSSNLASNVMPRGTTTGVTEALAQATASAASATKGAMNAAGQVRTNLPPGVLRGDQGGPPLAPRGITAAEEALANREKAQGAVTAAQFERLLSQNAAILRVLRRIAQDQDHPEAKFNRKQSPAAVVVGVS